MRGTLFDGWFRLVAGWDLRDREDDQWGALGMTLLMVAAFLSAGLVAGGGGLVCAVIASVVVAGLYLSGLWADGGDALDQSDD